MPETISPEEQAAIRIWLLDEPLPIDMGALMLVQGFDVEALEEHYRNLNVPQKEQLLNV